MNEIKTRNYYLKIKIMQNEKDILKWKIMQNDWDMGSTTYLNQNFIFLFSIFISNVSFYINKLFSLLKQISWESTIYTIIIEWIILFRQLSLYIIFFLTHSSYIVSPLLLKISVLFNKIFN